MLPSQHTLLYDLEKFILFTLNIYISLISRIQPIRHCLKLEEITNERLST